MKYDKIGIIGLGIIGKGVADTLRKTDCEVYVWNRTPKPEPNFLGSPAEVAKIANVIQIFVSDGKALLSVLDQMKESLTSDHLVMNHATIDPHSTHSAHEIVAEAGAQFLDAPFTGSKEAAANGALTYYLGGDSVVVGKATPTLQLSSKAMIHVGEIGEASVIKIATNMISAATVEVMSEAYGLTKAAGIDPNVLKTAIENNACSSVLTGMKLPSIIDENYEPHFSLNNMFKDSKFALELAKQFGIEMPVHTTTANVMYRSIQKGNGEEDFSVVAKAYQS